MHEEEGQNAELAILIAQTWQSSPHDRIDLDTICRIWAFDLGWFNMETAIRVRDNLIGKKWLDVTPEGLKPLIDVVNVEIPFGWLPNMRFLESPPSAPIQTMQVEGVAEEKGAQDEQEKAMQDAAIDPAATHITRLLEQIASESGLERKEVIRRAQRKRRALGPVTLWMALMLVAREQHLTMPKLIRTISP